MHRRTRSLLSTALATVAAVALIGVALPASAASPAASALAPAAVSVDGPVDAAITVPRVENLPDDFIGGVDVSSVLSLEESGVVFRDAQGAPGDLFEILADAGVTDVRVRVWNDPFDANGNGYGGGDVDVDRAIEISQRATDAGLGVLVDFHYSDFWADPAKQQAPKAWEGMTADQVATEVGAFTRDAVRRLVDAGVDLRMVQVGNETNGGVAGVRGWDDMAKVFSAGSAAVRAEAPDTLVALHFTNPERAGFYADVAAQLDRRDVDYDVFASSYYPFWHGTPENLTAVLSHVAETYGKKVMVAETSWAFTLDDGDGHGNVVDLASEATQYPVSVQGQADAVRAVVQAVADVGEAGLGVYYWEPAWLPVGPPAQLEQNRTLWERDGSGWASSFAGEYEPEDAGHWFGGSAWDNQALFGFDGTASDALNIFSYVRTGAQAPRAVESVQAVALQVTEGDAVELPDEVTVLYNDGSSEQQPVTWSSAAGFIEGAGEYVISGATDAGLAASATVTVSARNYLRNPGFEDADTSMWSVTGSGLTLRAWDDPRSGTHSAHFYAGTGYSFDLSQTVSGLPAGSYVARASLQGDGEGADGRASLSLSSASVAGAAAAFGFDGWRVWSTPTTEALQVGADGTAVVRVSAALPAGAWGTIDDLELVRAPVPGADTSQLRERRDAAAALDLDAYVASSTVALPGAIARADIVLAAASPSASAVTGALDALAAAVDALLLQDAATAAPARGVLSHDNGHDTGLLDGDFTLTMNLWWGQNATKLRVFENGVLIKTVPLAFGGTSAQSAQIAVTGKANGSYVYSGELVNSRGVTAVKPVTVTVKDAAPSTPVLSADNWDGDGSYTLTADMWWGTNATSYRLYEDGMLISEGDMVANSPAAQRVTVPVADRAVGKHTYRVEFVNAAGSTQSKTLTVAVKR
ncbi:glycosyl hydrolase 53 family protein [Microbacterium sp. LMC-P-041]|uniref:glycosyl hydrolase 53 family protein n=1 Tax=Microbacterium sp. LMC-P-041 TaxID=3040293 RepID=UPI0025533D40|nr:glycosyl hydrolase 53 family protein [Microbacterium sp. LMC-P-041]